MLERDLYLLVCLAFNHWHTGIEDPSLFPQCVLAIHSSKRLIVEQITPPPHLLADAIISLTLQKGQRHEGREGMTAYYLTKGLFCFLMLDKFLKIFFLFSYACVLCFL